MEHRCCDRQAHQTQSVTIAEYLFETGPKILHTKRVKGQ